MSIDYEKKILSAVGTKLQNYFHKNGNVQLFGVEVSSTVERSFSTVCVLLAKTSDGLRKLVVKTVKHHPINRIITEQENQAVVEYNILSFLYPKFKDVLNCLVPRPVIVIPEIETFVMEYVEGPLLIDQLRYLRYFSSTVKFRRLAKLFFYAGQWLRYFHDFTIHELSDSHAVDGVVERAEQRLKLIKDSGDARIPENFYIKVTDVIDEQLEQLGEQKILICGRHGDFMPLNIIAGSDCIAVIDYLGYKKEPVPVDILKMLVFLENELKSISSSPTRVKKLKENFLRGYGHIPEVPIPVIILCEAMQRIVSIWGSLCAEGRQLHHKLEANLCIRYHIQWFTNPVKRKLLLPCNSS